jgi:hypothetical protein
VEELEIEETDARVELNAHIEVVQAIAAELAVRRVRRADECLSPWSACQWPS